MTTTPAGWYPDPAGSGGQRWWDGTTWGEQVQPAPQPVAQQWGAGAPAQQPQWGTGAAPQWGAGPAAPWGPQQPAAPQSFAQRNKTSLIAMALAVVCVVIAATTHYILFAFIPVIVAVQAVSRREPLAWPAVGIGVALAIFRFMV